MIGRNLRIVFKLTQPSGYTEITNIELIKELYIRQYKYRISDGKDYVLNFTADRYIDLINGLYTDVEVFSLESHVKNLFDELNNGLWLTAQNTNSNLAGLRYIYTINEKRNTVTIRCLRNRKLLKINKSPFFLYLCIKEFLDD